MDANEFMTRWHINDLETLNVLDDLYLCFTKTQALALVAEYYDHADEIFNSVRDKLNSFLTISTFK